MSKLDRFYGIVNEKPTDLHRKSVGYGVTQVFSL